MRGTKLFIAAGLLYSSFNLEAQICEDVENGAHLIYMNGNATTPKDADEVTIILESFNLAPNFLTKSELKNPELNYVNVELKHNDSPDVLNEASSRARDELGISFVRAYAFYALNVEQSLSEDEIQRMREIFLDVFGTNATNFNGNASKLTTALKNSISINKKRTILVAHSQGALFSNAAYENVFSALPPVGLGQDKQKNAGVFYIAPVSRGDKPSGSLDSSKIFADYLTRTDDAVANRVRSRFIPEVPPANITRDDGIGLKHDVLTSYLRDLRGEIELRLQIIGRTVRDASCRDLLACFAINPDGHPGEKFTNADGSEGGFISSDSTVESTAYIGVEAEVCNGARVLGNATVMGKSIISDPGTVVKDNAFISGDNLFIDSGAEVSQSAQIINAFGVGLQAKVFGQAIISGPTFAIGNVEISGNAKIEGQHAIVGFAGVDKKVEIKGNTWIEGNYAIADNAKIDGNFHLMKKGAVVGDVVMNGSGETENTNYSERSQILTTDLVSLGDDTNNGNIFVLGDSKIEGSPSLQGQIFVQGNSYVSDFATIADRAIIMDNAQIIGSAQVRGTSVIWQDAIISGTASINGNSGISANCVLTTGSYSDIQLPNLNNKSDPLNQNCPGFYETPVPMLLGLQAQSSNNFVEMNTQDQWQQLSEEQKVKHENMLAEIALIKQRYLNREYQNQALTKRSPAGQ